MFVLASVLQRAGECIDSLLRAVYCSLRWRKSELCSFQAVAAPSRRDVDCRLWRVLRELSITSYHRWQRHIQTQCTHAAVATHTSRRCSAKTGGERACFHAAARKHPRAQRVHASFRTTSLVRSCRRSIGHSNW